MKYQIFKALIDFNGTVKIISVMVSRNDSLTQDQIKAQVKEKMGYRCLSLEPSNFDGFCNLSNEESGING